MTTVAARRLASAAYRRVAAVFGRRALARARAEGLPEALMPALEYMFEGRLTARACDVRERVERHRTTVAACGRQYVFSHTTTPSGPAHWLVDRVGPAQGPVVTPRDLAWSVAVPERWGLFLHLLAEAAPVGDMLELGTSAGISAAYISAARPCRLLTTIEGSPAIARLAADALADFAQPVRVVVGTFDAGLEETGAMLAAEGRRLSLVYIDGHHDERPTLDYVSRVAPWLGRGALVVLDDIYLYAGMWRAWRTVSAQPGFAAAVNVGRFGVLVCGAPGSRVAQFDLSPYTGWWRVGHERRRPPA